MSATTLEQAANGATVVNQPVTLRRAVVSEWIKFRTLRSTLLTLLGAVLGILLIGLIVAFNTRHLTGNQDLDDLDASATLQGRYLAQLLIGALGVLFVAGEYSTGMIRSTMAAVPKRLPVIAAKALVFAGIIFVSMEIMSLVTFLVTQALIGHYRTGYSLGDPTALRVVLGTGLYLTLLGLIGISLGWIVRSLPGALVTYVALILLVPVLFGLFGTWGADVAKFFPSAAGDTFVSSLRESGTLPAGAGLAVLVGWVVLLLAGAAWQLRRRDV